MTEPGALTRGTFTFLFSDIEGSTRLEQAVGRDRYAELRERQRAILREASEAHGGIEQGTEGDSFFVVFHEAPDAVEAAVAAQRALAAEPWPDDATVRVRMGLHTGECRTVRGEPGRAGHQPGGADRGAGPRRPDPRLRAWSGTSSSTARSTGSRCATSASTGSRT